MRKSHLTALALGVAGAVLAAYVSGAAAQTAAEATAAQLAAMIKPGDQVQKLEDAYLVWPVAAKDAKYNAINGNHLLDYVKEVTAISDRYRDQGHQLWGRLEGTSSDVESADWMTAKLKAAGFQVRSDFIDLPPQWLPKSWEISTNAGGKAMKFATAQPATGSEGTDGKVLNLEVAYVGLGSDADYMGRDIKGKAVLIWSEPQPGIWGTTASRNGATKRAVDGGAAAVIVVEALPGNITSQISIFPGVSEGGRKPGEPPAVAIPGFTMGLDDGEALRHLVGSAPAGQPVHINLSLDARRTEGLKTQLVWGDLPGMTDEKIIIVAHRDGWFEGAGDNASGMATAIGLAEYYGKLPKSQRRRTIEILGASGHHGTQVGMKYIADHKDTLLNKTALIMNAEHTALTQQYQFAGNLRPANTTNAEHWSFNGSQHLIDTAIDAFKSFGVATYDGTDGVAMAEISGISRLAPSFGVINVDTYYHTDHETPDKVPATGLGAVTRAFAKLIDGVNKYSIAEIQPAATKLTSNR